LRQPRKPKPNEPSLRDKLSQNFLRAFEADFASYSAEVIEQLRESHPDRYAEVAVKLIASAQPPASIKRNPLRILAQVCLRVLA